MFFFEILNFDYKFGGIVLYKKLKSLLNFKVCIAKLDKPYGALKPSNSQNFSQVITEKNKK